MMTLVQQTRGE